ncbi:MAG: MBL fold metallo-hydrolase [Lachnospiraceae bacterium]|nr:MBL fold metallo-hydrolase [Lachnospiraceae bacterium]
MKKSDIKEINLENLNIVLCNGKNKWNENCYLVTVDNNSYLIDPGFDCEDIIDYIKEKSINVKFVLITHAHHDHIASADEICKALNIKCYIHKADYRMFMHAPMYSLRFANRMIKRPDDVIWIENTDFDQFLKYGFKLISTPGHSKGGICVCYNNVVFTGDTLVKNYVGRTDLPDGNTKEIIESVNSLFKIMEKQHTEFILPGHGDIWNVNDATNWWNNNKYCLEEKKSF